MYLIIYLFLLSALGPLMHCPFTSWAAALLVRPVIHT